MRPVAKRALEIINYEIVLNISCQILTSAASPMEQRHQQRLAQFQAGLSAGTGRCRGMGKHVHEGKRRTGRCSQQGESEKEPTHHTLVSRTLAGHSPFAFMTVWLEPPLLYLACDVCLIFLLWGKIHPRPPLVTLRNP